MKKILSAIILIILPVLVHAQLSGSGTYGDPWSGTLDGDATWSGTKYINGDITVDNEKLTISSGAIIIFLAEGADLIINGTGWLEAVGISGSPITFTADDDDDGIYGEGGPPLERWGHIVFDNPSSSNLSELEYCIVEYGDVSSGSHINSYGGGVCADIYSNLTLTNCTIRYNKATHGGGIMVINGSSPNISNCLISENTAITSGGGIYLSGGTSSITNSLITKNYSGTGGGGGIFFDGSGSINAVNSLVVDNTTTGVDRAYNVQYYGINSSFNRPSFKNCIVWSNDNSISYSNSILVSTDFVNCGIQDVSNPASSYSSCIDLNATNDNANGPNFVETDGTDWSIKFISPCRDAGTTPSPTVPNDYDGNPRIGPYDIGAYEVQYSRWKTDASTPDEWLNTGNWEQDFEPGHSGTTGDVVIPALSDSTNAPDISVATTIASTKSMILEPGAKATFATLTNNGTLKLEADADSVASLIVTTFSGNDANIELYLTGGGTSTTYKWHYISSPFSTSPSITPFTAVTQNLARFDQARYSSSVQGWVAFDGYIYSTPPTSGATPFSSLSPGTGYNFYDNVDNEITISGKLQYANVNVTLYFGGHGADYSGFNLLGNPFSSGLDWDAIVNESYFPYPASTSKGLYFTRNNVQCSYIAGVGDPGDVKGIIPPMQGFFTKTENTGNPTLTLPAAARTHNSIHARYKGKTTIPLVRLSITKDSLSDGTVVRFDEQAKPDLDNDFDALKMFLSDNKLSIYSYDGETKYAINGQPFPETEVEIPIVVNLISEGDHKVSAIQLQGLDNYHVTLKDLVTGFDVDLKTTPELTFTDTAGTYIDRFLLTISSTTGIKDIPDLPGLFNVFAANNLINIKTLSDNWNGKSGTVRIFDITGRTVSEIHNKEFWKNSILQVPAPSTKGIYFVELRAGGERYVGKVSVR